MLSGSPAAATIADLIKVPIACAIYHGSLQDNLMPTCISDWRRPTGATLEPVATSGRESLARTGRLLASTKSCFSFDCHPPEWGISGGLSRDTANDGAARSVVEMGKREERG